MGCGWRRPLTLGIAVWPWLYVVQVGDSRCYVHKDGVLKRTTRDQTMAQDLVDRGALLPERLAASPFSHVLVSAIGGEGQARSDQSGYQEAGLCRAVVLGWSHQTRVR